MNDGMWSIWMFAALGVFFWIDHLRHCRNRLQGKLDVAEKLRAYVAMSDKRRAEYLDELNAAIEEDHREGRMISELHDLAAEIRKFHTQEWVREEFDKEGK